MAHATLTLGSRGDPGDVIQVNPQNKNMEPFQIFDGKKTLMWYKMQPFKFYLLIKFKIVLHVINNFYLY